MAKIATSATRGRRSSVRLPRCCSASSTVVVAVRSYQPRRETRRSSADIMYNCKGPPRHEEGQRVNSTASFLLSAGMLGDGEVYRYLFFCEPNVNCMLLVLDAADLESPRVFVYLQLSRSLPFRPRATLRFQCDTRFALHACTPTPSFFYPAHATFLCFEFSIFISICGFLYLHHLCGLHILCCVW